jgi:SAM-dependent methyltransferase
MNLPIDARALYDHTAANWSRHQPSSLSDYTARPQVMALCEPLAGRFVLDLGCGEGYCSRMLSQRGAQVLGLDVSPRMIELARQAERAEPLGIRYDTADAVAVDLGEASVDLVVAVFLFNYLDVGQMQQTMAQVHRMLRPGGSFVFAVPHPAFAFMRRELAPPFHFDIGDAGYFSARNRLFGGRIWKREGSALDVQLVHKTLQDYFDGLRLAGFSTMPTVAELTVTRDMVELDEAFFGPLFDLPLHLAVKVVRA